MVLFLHQILKPFPEVAPDVIAILMSQMANSSFKNSAATLEIVNLVRYLNFNFREIVQNSKHLDFTKKVVLIFIEHFHLFSLAESLRSSLWVLGEFCDDEQRIPLVIISFG